MKVQTFDAWATNLTGLSRERSSESFEAFRDRVTLEALKLTKSLPESRKYDAIFIDEGQDLRPEWFTCCVQALRGDAGDLVVAVDGAQSLYGRPAKFTWKSVGVQAQGRSIHLKTNYRNTAEIITFAWHVAYDGDKAPAGDTEVHVRMQPTKAKRRGAKPRFAGHPTGRDEAETLGRLVANFLADGFLPEQIGVLYSRREGDRVERLYDALRSVAPVCWVTNPADDSARHGFVTRPGVRLCTVHSAKGLEFPVVILTAADQFPSPMADDESAERNLFYVALTRATEHLLVIWSGSSDFTRRVEASPHAERL